MATLSPTIPVRGDNLALIFQEVLTVTVRLRANRLRFDGADVFRSQIFGAIESAKAEGLRRGYTQEDVNVAVFAVVAFLDESILNSANRTFAHWQSKPLQQELFGTDEAGDIIFRNISRLLGQKDSESLADLLEVHQLVLALGLRGRYSASGTTAEISAILQKIQEKISRIRGAPITPTWQPPPQTVVQATDPWIPIMKWVAISCCCVALLLFIIFKFSLSSAVTELSTLASQIFS
jgi:type VI secretion system protein ImpK